MKLKLTLFVLLLLGTASTNAWPQYLSDDCPQKPVFGKSSTTFDDDDYHDTRRFFTQSFLRRYHVPKEHDMGWYEEKWNSFSKAQGCLEAFEPCFLRPASHMTAGLYDWTLDTSLYAPGVRGLHWWKQPGSGRVVHKESLTISKCPSYNREAPHFFDRI